MTGRVILELARQVKLRRPITVYSVKILNDRSVYSRRLTSSIHLNPLLQPHKYGHVINPKLKLMFIRFYNISL